MSGMAIRDFWNSPSGMNRLSGLLLAASLVGMVALTAHWMANRPAFVIKRVIVNPLKGDIKHVSPSQIHAAIAEALNGTALSADLRQVHRALQSIPWVRTASVRRIWPNRLLVRIEEHRAVATWTAGGLVNGFGEVFPGLAADHEEDCRLIPLSGPAGSERLLLDRARQLTQWIAPMQRSLRGLTLSEQYAWTAELSGGLLLELGRDALATPVEERVRMFVKTQPWLGQRLSASAEAGRMIRADLRYATGYAFSLAAAGGSAAALGGDAAADSLCIGVRT